MRIAFLTNKTAIVSMPVLEKLVHSEKINLVHTFFYDTVAESRNSPRSIINQLGIRRVAIKIGQAVTSGLRRQVGKRLGSKVVRAKSPYELAVIADLPHTTVSDLNHPETIELLRQLNVDVMLVAVCKNILRQEVLSLDIRFVNVHPSLLPQYRGPTPIFWMLYHGEIETGVTFHLMTPRIDVGEILDQRSMPLDHNQSEVQIEREVFKLASTIVEDVLENRDSFQAGQSPDRNESQSSYHTFPTPAQRRELTQRLRKR